MADGNKEKNTSHIGDAIDIKGLKNKSSNELIKIVDDLQQKLIDSEMKGLGLFELTNDAIFLISLDGKY